MPKVIIPPQYLCPITHELMTDPVATADGQLYERKAIEKWLELHNTSPATNQVLANKNLITLPFVKEQFQDF